MESEAAALNEAELDVIHYFDIKPYLTEKVKQFQAVCIKNHSSESASYTMDKEILGSVSDLSLEFSDNRLPHYHKRMEMRFSSKEELFLACEIKNLLQEGVRKESQHEDGEFISSIFLVPKSEDSFEMILNLKRLNENMPYIHFKIETIKSILTLVTLNCYIAKVDIKDAYYTIPILPEHQKYLKFYFKGKLYQFKCLANGLCSGPSKFTKLLKPLSF